MAALIAREAATQFTDSVMNGTEIDSYTWGLNGVNQFTNLKFSRGLFITLGLLTFGLLATRLYFRAVSQVRLLVTMNADMSARAQRYWSTPHSALASFIKKHLLYAPISRLRHNQEIQLGSVVSLGTLPTRLHFIMLSIYVVSNVVYCTVLLDYSQPKAHVVAEFRGRTGVMAVVNMAPLFLLAGRNNVLIDLLHISFDTYNIFHRWFGRIVVLESVAHMAAWMINKMDAKGMKGMTESIMTTPFLLSGTIATVCFIVIILHSPSPIRHAFYETFLTVHIILALVALATVYLHLKIDKLPQLEYVQLAIIFWSFDRFARLCKVFYRNVTRGGVTSIKVQALPGDACRVTFEMPRPWKYRPGQHVFIYMPWIAFMQSHPFSVAWSEEADDFIQEKKPTKPTFGEKPSLRFDEDEVFDIIAKKPSMSLVIQKRTGMTATLFDRAKASPNGTMHVRGFVEGPYGGHHQLHSYGTTILFAGGVGITHQVGYIRDLITGYQNKTVATRKIVLVWIVRSAEQLEWIRPWMDQILPMDGRRELLKILLFVTRPKSPREIQSTSATIQMFPGKPNIETIMKSEVEERIGSVAVTVCGPGTLQDTVRNAVRQQVEVASVDFFEESFTW